MTTISRRSASHMATADLPDAVGPQMTGIVAGGAGGRTSAPAEAPLELIPREVDDRGPPVHVMRRKRAIPQRDEERAHLPSGQGVAGLDRGLACDRRGEMLMPRRGRRLP